jgi:GT2 family glycosyltransferase
MKFFSPGAILSRAPAFMLCEEGGEIFFAQTGGGRIQTDDAGKAAWESLPGGAADVVEKYREKLSDTGLIQSASPSLCEEILYVLYCAGIVDSSSRKNSSPASLSLDHAADLISVVVVTYNGQAHIRDCFGSLASQSFHDHEIIAVDNGSTDGTGNLLRELFPQVRVIGLPKNIHFAGAVNIGLTNSRGQYIFVLNQDVELDRDALAHLYNRMRREERAAAIVPMMKFFDLRGFVNGIGNHLRKTGWGSDNFIGCVDVGQFTSLAEVPSACFGAVFLNRAALDDVGLLDEGYTAFYEDTDWSFRCWLKKWRIVPEARAVVYHKFGASYPGPKKLMFVVRNRQRLVLKLFRGRLLLSFLKNYLIEDVRNFLSLTRRRHWDLVLAYVEAYVSLVWSIPRIFIKRRRLAKSKLAGNVADILAKNPPFFSCLNNRNIPVIDAKAMAEYYHPLLAGLSAGRETRSG